MLFVPLRPPILVARPRDWTAVVTRLLVTGLTVVFVVIALLVRLPGAWVSLAAGYPWIVRAVLLLLSLWIVRWLGDLAYSRLPRASFLIGGTLVFPEQARRRSIRIEDINRIVVALRPAPAYEVFVAVMRDETTHQICATHQVGGPALYAAVARRVARARRAQARHKAAKRQHSPNSAT